MIKLIDVAGALIKRHEGFRAWPYRCSAGRWTIGWGHNIDDKGLPDEVAAAIGYRGDGRADNPLTDEKAEELFEEDFREAVGDAKAVVPNFCHLDAVRQAVLVDMAFQLGRGGLRGFAKMIVAIRRLDWGEARHQMLDSKYARVDTPGRAEENARLMLDGEVGA